MADLSPPALDARLIEHRVLIFDVYGTLIDWESAIYNVFAPIFPDLTREEILINYARVEGDLQRQFPNTHYSKLLELAYHGLTASPGVTAVGIAEDESRTEQEFTFNVTAPDIPTDDARRFGRSIPEWKPFPDTVDALHRLKKHFALVVLSNVDDRSFAGTHEKLCSPDYPGSAYSTVTPDSPFSLILTAQQVGAYKPDPLVLESALRQFSVNPDSSLPFNAAVRAEPSQVLIVANSIRHDIIPATERGLQSVWISRHVVNFIGNEGNVAVSQQEGATIGGRYPYSWRYETLSTMADAVEGEAQV